MTKEYSLDQAPVPVFDSPAAAEEAFYRAFAGNDLDAMMAVWAAGDDIVCIHPMSPSLGGREPIRRSWAALFRDSPPMTLQVEMLHATSEAGLVVHLVHEHFGLVGKPGRPPMVATNVYRHSAHGWHMILHHASPAPVARTSASPPVLH